MAQALSHTASPANTYLYFEIARCPSKSRSAKIWIIKPLNAYAFCATLFIAGVAAVLFACALPLIKLG